MRRSLLVLTVLATTAAVACSAGRSRGDPFDTSPEGGGRDQLSIQVMNRNFNDATIHAVAGPRRIRLGIAPGNTNRAYTIDWPGGPRELRAEIDLVGGGRYVTAPLTASPGDRVTLVVEARLTNSYLRR